MAYKFYTFKVFDDQGVLLATVTSERKAKTLKTIFKDTPEADFIEVQECIHVRAGAPKRCIQKGYALRSNMEV